MLMNSEQVRILKEMALPNLKVLCQNSPGEINAVHEKSPPYPKWITSNTSAEHYCNTNLPSDQNVNGGGGTMFRM
jgi:hypothetical protein